MAFVITDLQAHIRQAKSELKSQLPNYREVFEELQADMRRRVDEIVAERDAGNEVIPIIQYDDVANGRVSEADIRKIKERGACVIRNTFPREQAEGWDRAIGQYVADNHLDEKLQNAAEDNYFGQLKSAAPQIYGIYWSQPQIEARQSTQHTLVRQFLNGLWKAESDGVRYFDPNETPVYADRMRRRPPASASLGLSPHTDGGSVERWLEPNFRKVYRHVYSGNWRQYDPFDAAYRPDVDEYPSPAVCSMFRTFQGWTALTRQGPGDGTLQLIPIASAMAYVLLRALQDDVPDDELCGSAPGRALSVNPEYHSLLIEAVSSIPLMEPGDTVFWHSDVVHAVEDDHKGNGYSNVIYIASAPGCAKNSAYLAKQAEAFLSGQSPPDFPQDNFEVDFEGRAGIADLSRVGRAQLGLAAPQNAFAVAD
jgi:hypothetical protein